MTRLARLRSAVPEQCLAAIAEASAEARLSDDELAALAACLGHARKAIQRAAAEALAAHAPRDPAARRALEDSLGAAEARRRWGAAFALSLLGPLPAVAVPVVLETLGADDGDLRWAAAAAILRVADRPALEAALRDLAVAGSAAQRRMALYCLRDLDRPGPEVDRVLATALADEDREVRLAAIAGLGRVAADRAAAARQLVHALDAVDERIRRAAAAALGTLGARSDEVHAALTRAAASADPALQRAAAGALRRLGAR